MSRSRFPLLIVLAFFCVAAACGSRTGRSALRLISALPTLSASPAALPRGSSSVPSRGVAKSSSAPSPWPTGSGAPIAGLREKPIDEFRLIGATRSLIELDVETTNRGCSREEFVQFDWRRSQSRIDVRAYYRDVASPGLCALFSETNRLSLKGLGPGTFAIYAPLPGDAGNPPVQIVVHVQ